MLTQYSCDIYCHSRFRVLPFTLEICFTAKKILILFMEKQIPLAILLNVYSLISRTPGVFRSPISVTTISSTEALRLLKNTCERQELHDLHWKHSSKVQGILNFYSDCTDHLPFPSWREIAPYNRVSYIFHSLHMSFVH